MELDNKKKTEKPDIKTVESYFKMLIIAIFSGILAYKVATATWTIDLTKFDFNAFLSLILALFSIGLSILFYFKATDTSNLFYDNTYKFTKDISEILGRIEAGFGERLRHLDEGYSGLRDKFTSPSSTAAAQTIEKTAKEIEDEKKKLEQQMKEKEQILEKLMTRAKIQDKEKSEILESINSKDEHINSLQRELIFLKRKLEKEEIMSEREIIHRYPSRIVELIRTIIAEQLGVELVNEAPTDIISRRFRTRIVETLSERAKSDFQKFTIIDDNNDLTEKGMDLFKNIAKRLL